MSSYSSSKRVKVLGAVLAATALVVVGVVMLGHTVSQMNPMERFAAIAGVPTTYENNGVPLANLPSESEVHVPDGWQVESDEAVAGAKEEELNEEEHADEEEAAEDDDIDSPLDVEEDENGEKYVAEMDDDVIVTEDGKEEQQEGDAKTAVAADRRYPRCFKNLRKCGYKKACRRKCNKYCPLKAKKICYAKKFCKCFCKYYKNRKAAIKCVFYKKKLCKKVLTYKCKKRCNKLCKRLPRCYCCARKHVRKACRRVCKRISYKTKCGKCRCYRLKCYKYCKFLCKKYKKY